MIYKNVRNRCIKIIRVNKQVFQFLKQTQIIIGKSGHIRKFPAPVGENTAHSKSQYLALLFYSCAFEYIHITVKKVRLGLLGQLTAKFTKVFVVCEKYKLTTLILL